MRSNRRSISILSVRTQNEKEKKIPNPLINVEIIIVLYLHSRTHYIPNHRSKRGKNFSKLKGKNWGKKRTGAAEWALLLESIYLRRDHKERKIPIDCNPGLCNYIYIYIHIVFCLTVRTVI